MEEVILFLACIFSFAAVLISFLFFLRYKKFFFLHVLLILLTFFMISANNFYAIIHSPLTGRLAICVFGAFLLNLLGLWIPTGFALLISIIFFKRIDTGVFRKEKWIIIILATLNLVLSFVLHSAPFIFIISISLLVFHVFYHFYFSSPISKTEKTLKDDFIKDFSITKREQEIIIELLNGKSNKELAEALFVSEKTIETHLANIYRKVGVKNRLELFSRLQND